MIICVADNLAEEIYKTKCKDFDSFLEYESVKDNLIKYKCLSCNNYYLNKIDEEFKKWFKKIFTFSNNGINKFILLFRTGVDPYEYIDEWKKFNETALPEKDNFYSNLNMKDITNSD